MKRGIGGLAIGLAAMCVSAASASNVVPWSDDFEMYTNGTPLINGTNGWYGSSPNIVVQDAVAAASKAAMIPVDCTLSNPFDEAGTDTNVYLIMDLRPARFMGQGMPMVDTNASALFFVDSNGYVVVHNGPPSPTPTNSANWITLATDYLGNPVTPIPEDTWVNVVVLQDYVASNWAIAVNSALLTNNLGFVGAASTNFRGFELYNGATTSYLDNVVVSAELPAVGGGIGLSTSALDYVATYGGASPADQTLTLLNVGNAGYTYSNLVVYGAGAGWLTVAPDTGVLAVSGSQVLTGSVNSAGLNAGVYTATNVVLSPDATNSPQAFSVTLTVNKATQTISFPNPGDQVTNNVVVLSASADSGLPVAFNVGGGPGVITTNGTTNLSFTGTGLVCIVADQAGDTNWYPAPSLTNCFDVTAAAKSNQTIAFPAIPDQVTTSVVVLSASASSGLPVGFGVDSGPGVIGTNGTTNLSFTGVGLVVVRAAQPGNFEWNPAPDVLQTVTVAKADQAPLNFAPASPQTYNTTNALSASGGSGTGAYSYAVQSGPGELVSPSDLRITSGVGTVLVVATKSADDLFLARSVTAEVVAAKAAQVISFPAIPAQVTTNVVVLNASAGSGLPVGYSIGSGPGAITISGTTNLTFTGAGTVNVVADQAGDDNWGAAASVTSSVTVSKSGQLPLVFNPTSPQSFNTTNPLSATGGSGTGAVSFAVTDGPGQIMNLTNLYVNAGSGVVTVVATKAADDMFLVQSATGSVTAARKFQTIDFPVIPDQVTTSTVGLSATASSSLPVTFSVGNGPATISGGTNLSFTNSGPVSIVASQAGDEDWEPTSATNSFMVNKAAQAALVFAPASPQTYNTTNALSATGGSGSGSISFSVQSGPGQLVGDSNLWVTSGVGTVTIVATKAADDLYQEQSATGTVDAAKAAQTVDFPNPGDQVETNTLVLSATASSGLPVTFSVGGGPAQLDGGSNLSFTGIGAVSIVADQSGDDNWTAAGQTNAFNVMSAGAIGVSTTELAYVATYNGPSPAAQTLTLTNSGQTAFSYSNAPAYGAGSGWFSLEPATGQVAGAAGQVLTGAVNSAGMMAGVYTVTNTLAAPEATNGPALVVATLTVGKADQAITFPAIPAQKTTNTVGLSATASSDLPVTFAVGSGPAQIDGGTNLTFTGSGVVSIVASQAGDANWNPAPDETNTFSVGLSEQAALSFTPSSPQVYDTQQTLAATGGSGAGAVTYAVQSGPGQIVDGTNLLVNAGTGTVVVVATKAADALYEPASATGQVDAAKAGQTIDFPVIPDQVTTGTVVLGATASSGLPVTFVVGSGPATLAGGSNLTFTGAGTVSIVASQAGDANWNPAADATNTFAVTKAPAQVTLGALSQTYNGTPRVATAATTPAGLPVALTYNGSATAPVNAGSYTVVGAVNHALYQGAKTGTLTVAKAGQTISFPAIPAQVTTSKVTLAATASSGLPVAFSVKSGPGVISGGTLLTFTGTGLVTVAANQAGNVNWKAAAQVLRTVTVNPARPMVTGLLADFDGDGKADPTSYDERTGTWKTKLSTAGYATFTFAALLGGPGWTPAAGDYDGDGLADPGVYQETTGNWKVMQSGSGYALLNRPAFLGGAGWAGRAVDFDGDGKAEYVVYQETTGSWKLKLSSAGYAPLSLAGFLGGPGKMGFGADYDGDGLAEPTIYTRADGTWKVLLTSAGYAPLTLTRFLGGTGWTPVYGDYDGDGLADPAVRKDDGSVWRVLRSGSGYAGIDLPLGL